MADLRASTSIGGNLAWHTGNLRLDTQGNTIRYAGSKIFSENDKPNPDTDLTVPVIKKAGDEMTGTLYTQNLINRHSMTINNDSNSPAPFTITRGSQVGIYFNDTTAPRYLGVANGNLYFGNSANHAINSLILTTSNYTANLDGRYAQVASAQTISGNWTFTGNNRFSGGVTYGTGIGFGSTAYIYQSSTNNIYIRNGANYLGIENELPVYNSNRLLQANQAENVTGNYTFTGTVVFNNNATVNSGKFIYFSYSGKNTLRINHNTSENQLDVYNHTAGAYAQVKVGILLATEKVDSPYIYSSGEIKAGLAVTVVNPTNTSATAGLNFSGNIPRIRVGGSGEGSASEFQIQGSGDYVRLAVANSELIT